MAGMARVIEYCLADTGALAAVILDGQRIELDACHIHDTFANMVEALLAVLEGQQEAEWVYFHGPGSTHLYLTHAGGRTAITLRTFRDYTGIPRPRFGDPGVLLGEGEVRLRDVVNDVVMAGSRMIESAGEAGYLRAWRRPFPASAFSRLKQLRRNR